MFFNQYILGSNAISKITCDIRTAVAAAKGRKLSVTISNRFCKDNWLPCEVDGRPEKVVLDYTGEFLVVDFNNEDRTLFENLSDAALLTIYTKLKTMGLTSVAKNA